MSYNGTVRGRRIDLDDDLPLPDGMRVRVDVVPERTPAPGTPAAVLRLVGSLTDDEAESLVAAAKCC